MQVSPAFQTEQTRLAPDGALAGRFPPPVERAQIQAFRRHVRAMARHYHRRTLPHLIHCPESWISSPKSQVTEALIGRLKRALYVERQKPCVCAANCGTVGRCRRSRLTALLIALCAELNRRRLGQARPGAVPWTPYSHANPAQQARSPNAPTTP